MSALMVIKLVTGTILGCALLAALTYFFGLLFATTSEELPVSEYSAPQAVESGATVSEVTAI